LHRLQFKHALIAAQVRPEAAHRIKPTRPAGDSNPHPFMEDVSVSPAFSFFQNFAPKVRQDFKICLKNRGAQQILEKKNHKTSLKNAKTRNWQQKFARCAFFVKTGNSIALKNP
jgi:hypothetical protein